MIRSAVRMALPIISVPLSSATAATRRPRATPATASRTPGSER